MMNLAILSVIAGAISCDTLVAGQFMIARPIIAGPLIGLAVGNPYLGFIIGVCVELVWIRVIPVGVSIPPDSTLTAVIATAAGAAAKYNFGIGNFSAAILALVVSIPFGILFKSVELRVRFRNSSVTDALKVSVAHGDFGSIDKAVYLSVAKTFAIGALFFAAAVTVITMLPKSYWNLFGTLGINTKILMRFVYILCFAQLFENFVKWK